MITIKRLKTGLIFSVILSAAFLLTGCGDNKDAEEGVFVQEEQISSEEPFIALYEPYSDIPEVSVTAEPVSEFIPQPTEAVSEPMGGLPDGFVYTTDIVPDTILEIRYYSTFNFVGDRIEGYNAPLSIMTSEAAWALRAASDALRGQGYAIKIYDSYRPEDAVAHFGRWGKDLNDLRMKQYFYPELEKAELFGGYISSRSGHSRGSTIDLTIINMYTGTEVDMGGPFDFLGTLSNHGTDLINEEQTANRLILKNAMEAAGFKAYSKEWWHYTLVNEPFSDTYFNFPVQ